MSYISNIICIDTRNIDGACMLLLLTSLGSVVYHCVVCDTQDILAHGDLHMVPTILPHPSEQGHTQDATHTYTNMPYSS